MESNVIKYINGMIRYYETTIRDFIESDDVVELLNTIKNLIEKEGETHE